MDVEGVELKHFCVLNTRPAGGSLSALLCSAAMRVRVIFAALSLFLATAQVQPRPHTLAYFPVKQTQPRYCNRGPSSAAGPIGQSRSTRLSVLTLSRRAVRLMCSAARVHCVDNLIVLAFRVRQALHVEPTGGRPALRPAGAAPTWGSAHVKGGDFERLRGGAPSLKTKPGKAKVRWPARRELGRGGSVTLAPARRALSCG